MSKLTVSLSMSIFYQVHLSIPVLTTTAVAVPRKQLKYHYIPYIFCRPITASGLIASVVFCDGTDSPVKAASLHRGFLLYYPHVGEDGRRQPPEQYRREQSQQPEWLVILPFLIIALGNHVTELPIFYSFLYS